MKVHGDLDLQNNKLIKTGIDSETTFPEIVEVGRLAFVDRILYLCSDIVNGLPIWYPLTNSLNTFEHNQIVASSTWNITHSLDTTTPIVQVIDNTNNFIHPSSVVVVDNNTISISFGVNNVSGVAVIMHGNTTSILSRRVVGNSTPHAAWRLVITAKANTYLSAKEIRFFNKDNVRVDQNSTYYSSSESSPNGLTINAFDNDNNTSWTTSSNTVPAYIGFVPNSFTAVDLIEYYTIASASNEGFELLNLEYTDDIINNQSDWNNANWTVHKEFPGFVQWSTFNTKKIRVYSDIQLDPDYLESNTTLQLSNNNFTVTNTANSNRIAKSSFVSAPNLLYFEVSYNEIASFNGFIEVGIGNESSQSGSAYSLNGMWTFRDNSSFITKSSITTSTPTKPASNGDTYGIGVDIANNTMIIISNDGTALTMDFGAINKPFTSTINRYHAIIILGKNTQSVTVNFGKDQFFHTPPAGYISWQSATQ